MTKHRPLFAVRTCARHGEALLLGSDGSIPLGLPLLLGFSLAPPPPASPRERWHRTLPVVHSISAGAREWRGGRPGATVHKQAFGFHPTFSLGRHCCSAAAASAAPMATGSSTAFEQGAGHAGPWLGAELDVGGFTKIGFMRGGGKEHNQDRGLILQQFRTASEMLLGVFDGHGAAGHHVSVYVAQHLPAVLMSKLAAAAASLLPPSSSDDEDEGGLAWAAGQQQQQQQGKKRSHKQDKQQQQQQRGQGQGAHELPYVLVPDRLHQRGPSAAAPEGGGRFAPLRDAKRAGARHPRHVAAQRLVPRPPHGSEAPPAAAAVPCALVAQVPMSQGLVEAAFAETDHMLGGSGVNVLDSGSTAVICHVGRDAITAAWVGDSRAVVGRRDGGGGGGGGERWRAVQITDDHKPERPDEKLRITLNDGRVEQMRDAAGQGIGPHRVWFKQIDYPGLAMSRAYGDVSCRRIGVTCEPELSVHRLSDADQLLVVATDGVFEYLTNQEVVDIAAGPGVSADAAARRLVEAAEQRWVAAERGLYVDDITAVVVKARPRRGGGGGGGAAATSRL